MFRVAYRWRDPKPRLCVDPSTPLSPTDTGNPNRFIDDPGVNPDENPPIYYGNALIRYLIWIWNLRISYPFEEILQMADDISAAFHRVLYHPDLAIVFATVWRNMLVVPVGTIFGARNSPSFYMIKGEMRSHFTQSYPTPDDLPIQDLTQSVVLPPPPTTREALSFAQATPDSQHTGIRNPHGPVPERRQPAFVDDSGNAHIRKWFLGLVNCSVTAAYILFGYPRDDPNRPPCINPIKWQAFVTHLLLFLGYEIDTRTMRLIWPIKKREKLIIFLDELLAQQTATPRIGSTPHACSQLVGLLRHAAIVSPIGIYRSLHLQFHFNDLVSKAPGSYQLRRWYQRPIIHLPQNTIKELQALRRSISMDRYAPGWSRPIGLIIPRDPTIQSATDASTYGLGGWCATSGYQHMWRITVPEFVAAGLPQSYGFNNPQYGERAIDPLLHHINILEFIAIIIELWITVKLIFLPSTPPIPAGGHRILNLADNTSAVSWMRYATRTKRPVVRRIARFLQAFLSHPLASESFRVQGRHIRGIKNVGADRLSRFEKWPSLASVMEGLPALQSLPICPIPCELLSILATLVSVEQTEAWYETKMTRLWTLELPTFVPGSDPLVDTKRIVYDP